MHHSMFACKMYDMYDMDAIQLITATSGLQIAQFVLLTLVKGMTTNDTSKADHSFIDCLSLHQSSLDS